MSFKSYFRSSGYTTEPLIKTDSGETLDISLLPSFLRTLLVMDGTVTKSLSAWFWEAVMVELQYNQLDSATSSIIGLEGLEQGNTILKREVILRGRKTKKIFACARSVVSLKNLPSNIAYSLENDEMGIGELLRENGIETYRDIFNINYFSSSNDGDPLLHHLSGEIVSRSYRIRVEGVPAIIVTEYFPVSLYQ